MLSLTGDSFFSATLAIWIIDKLARGASWLPLATGALAIAVVVPSLVVSPLAGVWVDRWNPRWTMIWVDGIQTVLVVLFLLMTLLVSNNSLLLIGCFATILLISSGQQFFQPARVVVVADLVPEEHRMQAYSSLQQANYLAQIVGPALAAPLYFALGPAWAILLNALSFAISMLFVLLIPMQQVQEADKSQQAGFWQELRKGWQFFVTSKVLVTLLISGMIVMLGAQVYNSFEFLYGVQNLHAPQALLGLYVACLGIGVVGGLPIVTALAKRWSEVEVLWICLIIFGLALLVLSRITTVIPGMVCVLVLGMTQSSVFVAVRPLTVLVTPRNLMGRVMSFEVPMITIASLVGGAVASILASTVLANLHTQLAGMVFGPLDTLFVAAGFLVVGGGIYARLTLYRAVKEFRAKREVPG